MNVTQPIARATISRNPMGGKFVLRLPYGLPDVLGEWGKAFPVGTSFGAEQHFVTKGDLVREIVTSALPATGWLDWVDMHEGGIGWPFSVDVTIEREVTKTRHLAPWMAEYAAMFVLSGVVRYHPPLWVGMIAHRGNSKILALVEAFVSFAERDFPSRTLEMLKRVKIVKGYVTSLDELIVDSLG
jgi:hypothetical protein